MKKNYASIIKCILNTDSWLVVVVAFFHHRCIQILVELMRVRKSLRVNGNVWGEWRRRRPPFRVFCLVLCFLLSRNAKTTDQFGNSSDSTSQTIWAFCLTRKQKQMSRMRSFDAVGLFDNLIPASENCTVNTALNSGRSSGFGLECLTAIYTIHQYSYIRT